MPWCESLHMHHAMPQNTAHAWHLPATPWHTHLGQGEDARLHPRHLHAAVHLVNHALNQMQRQRLQPWKEWQGGFRDQAWQLPQRPQGLPQPSIRGNTLTPNTIAQIILPS